jgi:hypothetical protein
MLTEGPRVQALLAFIMPRSTSSRIGVGHTTSVTCPIRPPSYSLTSSKTSENKHANAQQAKEPAKCKGEVAGGEDIDGSQPWQQALNPLNRTERLLLTREPCLGNARQVSTRLHARQGRPQRASYRVFAVAHLHCRRPSTAILMRDTFAHVSTDRRPLRPFLPPPASHSARASRHDSRLNCKQRSRPWG